MSDTDGKAVLVAGSTAIDQTGFYRGCFSDYQSQYEIKALNMSFQLDDMQTSFGGCAPNIAYGLAMLGVEAIPLSSAGRNFRDRYRDHLISAGVNVNYIAVDDDSENSASCLMINDSDGNQIIGFFPGPDAKQRPLPSQIAEIDRVGLAILGPELPELTLRQARDLAALDIPMMFDPGQVVAEYQRAHIEELLSLSSTLIVNESELDVLCTNASLRQGELAGMLEELVITHGARGVEVFSNGEVCRVDALPGIRIVDVTGCGDAFRAGYAYGILNGMTQDRRAQFGNIMAALNLQAGHTQSYLTSLDEVLELRLGHYG